MLYRTLTIRTTDDIDASDTHSCKRSGAQTLQMAVLGSNLWAIFVQSIPIALLSLIMLASLPQGLVPDRMRDLRVSLGFALHRDDCFSEAYIAFLTWSTSYLFIRRACNPETTCGVVQRFGADAVFGGIAAAGAVLLKALIRQCA
jgi:hypothetical protein